MMKVLKPARLTKGDTIGIIVPASPPKDSSVIDKGKEILENKGYNVILGSNCRKKLGFLAGTDEERASDIMAMFADPGVKMVQCLRGGWGAARLLGLLDFDLIRENPKILVGFSDITMLLLSIQQLTGLVTFHGPMITSHFTKDDPPAFTDDSFWRMITEMAPFGSIIMKDHHTPRTIIPGQTEGALVGGNLSIIATTLGTPFEIDTEDKILFIEDVDEKPYRIDRLLTHLLNAGKLQQCNGIICGAFTGAEPGEKSPGEWSQGIDDILNDRLGSLGIPVAMGFPFGHIDEIATLPVGVPARLVVNENNADLLILTPAVQ